MFTTLRDLPVDLLQHISLEVLYNDMQQKNKDNIPPLNDDDDDVSSDYSGDDTYFSDSDDIESDNGIEIDQYINLFNFIGLDEFTYQELTRRITQQFIQLYPQKCIPSILSTSFNTEKWFGYLSSIIKQNNVDVCHEYICTGFENACYNDNNIAFSLLFEQNVLDLNFDSVNESTSLKVRMLIKVAKVGNIKWLQTLLRSITCDYHEAYKAFVLAFRNRKWEACHILLKTFPNMSKECWSYKTLRNGMSEQHKRIFCKHWGPDFIKHNDDKYKTFPATGYNFQIILKEPLPKDECYGGKQYDINILF